MIDDSDDYEIDLSPNHGWCISGEEPKGTKISPKGYMQMLLSSTSINGVIKRMMKYTSWLKANC